VRDGKRRRAFDLFVADPRLDREGRALRDRERVRPVHDGLLARDGLDHRMVEIASRDEQHRQEEAAHHPPPTRTSTELVDPPDTARMRTLPGAIARSVPPSTVAILAFEVSHSTTSEPASGAPVESNGVARSARV